MIQQNIFSFLALTLVNVHKLRNTIEVGDFLVYRTRVNRGRARLVVAPLTTHAKTHLFMRFLCDNLRVKIRIFK